MPDSKSPEAVTTRRPSGLKTALQTALLWPWNAVRSLPLSVSWSRAVLSSEAMSTGEYPLVDRAKDRRICSAVRAAPHDYAREANRGRGRLQDND
jgi:hypothetical protein